MLAGVVWDPALLKTLLLFENVQKFALRICSKQWDSSYDALLNVLTVPIPAGGKPKSLYTVQYSYR